MRCKFSIFVTMKNYLLLIGFCALYLSGFGQNKPIIQYHSFSGELNEKTDTLHRKYIYKFNLDVQKGEMVLVKSSSLDFAVSLCVRNSAGDTLGGVEIPKYYHEKGSYLSYLFKPAAEGKYQLLFTSKDSYEKGKFTVNYAGFNPDQTPFDDNAELCEKLMYMIQHSGTDFQFVVKGETKDFSLTHTRTTDYYLVTPSKCEIEYFTSDAYVCTMLEQVNLEKCIQTMKETDYEIKHCLTPAWKISELKRDDVRPMYKERFEKEYDYVLPGLAAGDMNEFHRDRSFNYSIRLLIEKDLVSGYDLKIILE